MVIGLKHMLMKSTLHALKMIIKWYFTKFLFYVDVHHQ